MPCSCPEPLKVRAACRCGEGPVIRRALPAPGQVDGRGKGRAPPTGDPRVKKSQPSADPRVRRRGQLGKGASSGRLRSGGWNEGTETRWGCGAAPGEEVDTGDSWIVTGNTVLSTANANALDHAVAVFMSLNHIPNGALAVVSGNGRLVHARGYTRANDFDIAGEPVFVATERSKFRVASVSKLVTAIATLQCDEAGLLPSGLDTPVHELIDLVSVPPSHGARVYAPEPRGLLLTIKHLLMHTGGWFEGPVREALTTLGRASGWVKDISSPAMQWDSPARRAIANIQPFATMRYSEIASAFGSTWPVTRDQVLRYGNTLPMSWSPGDHYSYCNYGYWLLGRVIEAVTCRGYDDVVRDWIWGRLRADNSPGAWGAGAWDSVLGDTRRNKRAVNEVPYYDNSGWPGTATSYRDSVMQSSPREAAEVDYEPYAEFNVGLHDAHGGWLSSVYDLALLMRDIFAGPSTLLSSSNITELLQRRRRSSPTSSNSWGCYGIDNSGTRYVKGGQFDGTIARVENIGSPRQASLVYMFNRGVRTIRGMTNTTESTMLTLLRTQLNGMALPAWGGSGDDLF